MPLSQTFAKRTGQNMNEVMTNDGTAHSLEEYLTHRSRPKEHVPYVPPETPVGIWSGPSAFSRSRPSSAFTTY